MDNLAAHTLDALIRNEPAEAVDHMQALIKSRAQDIVYDRFTQPEHLAQPNDLDEAAGYDPDLMATLRAKLVRDHGHEPYDHAPNVFYGHYDNFGDDTTEGDDKIDALHDSLRAGGWKETARGRTSHREGDTWKDVTFSHENGGTLHHVVTGDGTSEITFGHEEK